MLLLIKTRFGEIAESVGRMRWAPGRPYRALVARLAPARPAWWASRPGAAAACPSAGTARLGDETPGRVPPGAEDHLAGVFLNRLVLCHVRRGDYAAAEADARWGLGLSGEVVGAGHPAYATCVNNLGLILIRRGDLDGAEALLRPALSFYREAPGGPSRAQASSLLTLALVHERRGELAWAKRLYREGLDGYRFLGLDGHIGYADGLIALARVFWKQRDYDRAAGLMGEAQAIQRTVFGPRHPGHASTLIILACLSRKRGDLDTAEELLRDALDLRGCALGGSHPAYATCLHHLGLVLYQARDLVNADAALRAALAIRRDRLGDDHPLTVLTKNHLEKTASCLTLDSQEVPAFRDDPFADEGDPAPPADPGRGLDGGFGQPGPCACAERSSGFSPPPTPSLGVANVRPRGGEPPPRPEADRGGHAGATEAARQSALAVVGRVLALTHRDANRAESLRECASRASALRAALMGSGAPDLPPEAEQLAAGEHPLAALVTLVERQKELDNLTWARLHDVVAAEFGHSLATDVARGRVRVGGQPQPA